VDTKYPELFSLSKDKIFETKCKQWIDKPSPRWEKLSKAYVYKNLQMLPENLSMTDHFEGQECTDQRQEI
jgi:hypothetical protein